MHDFLCGSDRVGPTKVLREKVVCRSLSSIHILYNQALVGGLSMNATPARQIVNLQLPGGSTVACTEHSNSFTITTDKGRSSTM